MELKGVRQELKAVKKEIRDKPVYNGNFTKLGDFIEERIQYGLKEIKVHSSKKTMRFG